MSRALGLASIVLASSAASGCQAVGGMFGAGDFDVLIKPMSLEPVESAHVLVGKDDALKAESPDDIDKLLEPGNQTQYDFFVEFLAVPKDKSWRQASNVRGKEFVDQELIEIKVDEPQKSGEIEIKFDRDFLKAMSQDGLVVVVRYKDSPSKKMSVPAAFFTAGGDKEITILPSDLKVE